MGQVVCGSHTHTHTTNNSSLRKQVDSWRPTFAIRRTCPAESCRKPTNKLKYSARRERQMACAIKTTGPIRLIDMKFIIVLCEQTGSSNTTRCLFVSHLSTTVGRWLSKHEHAALDLQLTVWVRVGGGTQILDSSQPASQPSRRASRIEPAWAPNAQRARRPTHNDRSTSTY